MILKARKEGKNPFWNALKNNVCFNSFVVKNENFYGG